MGARRDKGLTVTRYLTGHTGIPLLSWDAHEGLTAPHPYRIGLVTARSLGKWHDELNRLPVSDPHMVIRYDYSLGSVDEAWVGMTLGSFVPLLKAHYEKEHMYRYQNGEM